MSRRLRATTSRDALFAVDSQSAELSAEGFAKPCFRGLGSAGRLVRLNRGGGARSQQRTILRGQFPVMQGINREFSAERAFLAELVLHKPLQSLRLFEKFPTLRNGEFSQRIQLWNRERRLPGPLAWTGVEAERAPVRA